MKVGAFLTRNAPTAVRLEVIFGPVDDDGRTVRRLCLPDDYVIINGVRFLWQVTPRA